MEDRTTELLRDLAQERREKVVVAVEGEDIPAYLIKVSYTEVVYTIDPIALPFKLVDFQAFSGQLKELYGLSPKMDNHNEDDDDPISVITGQRQRANALQFTNGKFELSNRDFIEISALNFTREKVHIALLGPSSIADVIIADAVEALWKCSGVSKRWDEILKSVQLKDYGTATKVKFNIKLEELLAPGLVNFLNNECLTGCNYAVKSAPRSYLNNFNPPDVNFCNYFVDDINLIFNVFDHATGTAHRTKLKFAVVANSEYGTGVYRVTSELPYDTHMEMLSKLQSYFQNRV